MAKPPQFVGKKLFGEVFKACNTPGYDKKLLRKLEKASTFEQSACFLKEIYKRSDNIKPDGTPNVDKIANQFKEYGLPIPIELEPQRDLNIENDIELFVDRAFDFIVNNKEGIKFVYYGSRQESFE